MTPSGRRREGRNAYRPDINIEEVCPYKIGQWDWESKRQDWIEGWKEADAQFDKDQEEKETKQIQKVQQKMRQFFSK